MPATHHIDNESRLILTTWEGEATDFEFIEALKKYLDDIQSDPEYIYYNEIVNLTEATPVNLSIRGLLAIGRIAAQAEKRIPGKKMALIIDSDFASGLANMYIFYRNMGDESRKIIAVFKQEAEAYKWIKNKT